VVDRYFGHRLQKIRCVDVGCHEGFYSVAMARKGVQQVRGIDVRESNLVKARFVDPDFRKRMEIDDLIAAFRAAN